MKEQGFSLKPFSDDGCSSINISGTVSIQTGRLSIQYELTADMAEIILPVRAERPARRDKLWEETCFELFAAPRGSERYWEFNLSPSGHWNVYRFGSYRQGMQEEERFRELPIRMECLNNILRLSLEVGTEIFMPKPCSLDIGITAVVRTGTGNNAYWALSHTGTEPDFHKRDSFIITL